MAGLKIVGEVEPSGQNRGELADETDGYGLRIPKATFSYSENDRRVIDHALSFMRPMLDAAGGRHTWTEPDTAHLRAAVARSCVATMWCTRSMTSARASGSPPVRKNRSVPSVTA
jgi:hypothetical protein